MLGLCIEDTKGGIGDSAKSPLGPVCALGLYVLTIGRPVGRVHTSRTWKHRDLVTGQVEDTYVALTVALTRAAPTLLRGKNDLAPSGDQLGSASSPLSSGRSRCELPPLEGTIQACQPWGDSVMKVI